MIENIKEERQIIYQILKDLNCYQKDRQELNQLMPAVGFEDDVTFAKSLFSERIIQIYQQHNTEYELFLAQDQVIRLTPTNRSFIFALFRKYHESKIKRSENTRAKYIQQLQQIKFPNKNNVQQIIKFQKNMYKILNNLMPQINKVNQQAYLPAPSLVSEVSKFSPFPIYPEISYHNFDSEYNAIASPFLQNIGSNDFKRHENRSFQETNSIHSRPSVFQKNNFGEFEHFNRLSYENSELSKEQPRQDPKFHTFNSDQKNTRKMIKTEVLSTNLTNSNIENMKKELNNYNKKATKDKPKQPQSIKTSNFQLVNKNNPSIIDSLKILDQQDINEKLLAQHQCNDK